MSEELGMATEKDDFNEWYNEVIKKAGLADHSAVSGVMVIRPYAYDIWERVKEELDKRLKEMGVRNAYFPLFIPESLLEKEAEHVEGFSPEVAWVTHGGDSELGERLAVRPTSETIMYDSFRDWIRSWRDLPMRINQWNNVVRWEFKHARPFLRTREFLWQEGHTAHATRESAEEEIREITEIYRTVCEDYMAIPTTIGRKTEKEKFDGAVSTHPLEHLMPDGKVIQGPDSHLLGQNFSKQFEITYMDENEEEKYVWQNSWGFSTRELGVMFAVHGDDSGLILPPKIAPVQAVVVPIYQEENREEVLEYAKKLEESLDFRTELDDRDEYSPGFKFNEWELKGVPVRIEVGPNEMEGESATLVRRDGEGRTSVSTSEINVELADLLTDIQGALFERAQEFVEEHTKDAEDMEDLEEYVDGNRVKAPWCGRRECEDAVKDETGAKISCLPREDNRGEIEGECVYCGEKAEHVAYFAKSY